MDPSSQWDGDGPGAFAETIRGAVLREAALYGDGGQPIVLRIELDKVHFKNVVAAMLVGDNSIAKGRVTVVDPATGQPIGTFAVKVNADRRGGAGGGIALFLVGALDPTGYVDVATTGLLGFKHRASACSRSAMNPSEPSGRPMRSLACDVR